MRRHHRAGRFILSALFCLFLFPLLLFPVASEDPGAARVEAAIASIRDIKLGVASYDSVSVAQRVEETWERIRKDGKAALPILREIVGAERQDDFLTLNASAFLLRLSPEPDSMQLASAALLRTDPNASPGGFYDAASLMASAHCASCLPAVLRVLDLKGIDISRPNLQLRIGIIHARILTLCQYGDLAIPRVLDQLSSSDCTARANAAAVTGDLQPQEIPQELPRMALGDDCTDARVGAVHGLTLLHYPKVDQLARQRFDGPAPLGTAEKEAWIGLLMTTPDSPLAKSRLASYAEDPDPGIRSAAKDALRFVDPYRELVPGSDEVWWRKKVHRLLQKAARTGRFTLRTDGTSIFTALTPEDVPLLNRARAAVLQRLTQDALMEWYQLSAMVSSLNSRTRATEPEPAAP